MNLFAPPEYWELTPIAKKEICNGCGAKGTGWLVPDTLWGLSVEEECNIHDFMYYDGETIEDKEKADRVFLNNMLRRIEAKSWAILKPLRRHRAKLYYRFVRDCGGPAFWANKNTPEDYGHKAPVDHVLPGYEHG